MINSKNIPALMKKCEVIYFIISDLDGNQLFRVDKETPAAAVQEWNGIERYLDGFKHIVIEGGTKATKDRTGAKKFSWEVCIDKATGSDSIGSTAKGLMTQEAIQTYINNAISGLEKDYKIKELEAKLKQKDPEESEGKVWAGLLKDLIGSDKPKGSALSGPDTLDVSDKAAVAAKLEALMESICKKVAVEKIIKLLKAVDNNPGLVDKALNFLA